MLTKWMLSNLIIFAMFVLSGCEEQILHNLSEGDANRIMNELSQASIEGEKIKQPDGKWSIAVSSSKVPSALSLLQRARLMRDEPKTIESNSFMGSREDQRFKFERNLSRELEKSLTSIDGVLEARVHLNLPPTDPLFGQKVSGIKGSASILLVTKGEPKVTKDEIAALVGGAAGIDKEGVTVLVSHEEQSGASQLNNITIAETSTGIVSRDNVAILACVLVALGSLLIFRVVRKGDDFERKILREKLKANDVRVMEEGAA